MNVMSEKGSIGQISRREFIRGATATGLAILANQLTTRVASAGPIEGEEKDFLPEIRRLAGADEFQDLSGFTERELESQAESQKSFEKARIFGFLLLQHTEKAKAPDPEVTYFAYLAGKSAQALTQSARAGRFGYASFVSSELLAHIGASFFEHKNRDFILQQTPNLERLAYVLGAVKKRPNWDVLVKTSENLELQNGPRTLLDLLSKKSVARDPVSLRAAEVLRVVAYETFKGTTPNAEAFVNQFLATRDLRFFLQAAASDPMLFPKMQEVEALNPLLGFDIEVDRTIKILKAREFAWREYRQAMGHPERPIDLPKPEIIEGVEVYGARSPIKGKAELDAIVLSINKNFAGSPALAPADIVALQEKRGSRHKRRFELVVPYSSYQSALKDPEIQKIGFVGWLKKHEEEINNILNNSEIALPLLKAELARVFIVDDEELARKKQEALGEGFAFGNTETSVCFLGPTNQEMREWLVDSASVWPFDLQGRWIWNYIPTKEIGWKDFRETKDGRKIIIDMGLVHELLHQLFDIGDLYVFDTPAGETDKIEAAPRHVIKTIKLQEDYIMHSVGDRLSAPMATQVMFRQTPAWAYWMVEQYELRRPGRPENWDARRTVSFTLDFPGRAGEAVLSYLDDEGLFLEIDRNALFWNGTLIVRNREIFSENHAANRIFLRLRTEYENKVFFLPIPQIALSQGVLSDLIYYGPERKNTPFQITFTGRENEAADFLRVRWVREDGLERAKEDPNLYAYMKVSDTGWYYVWTLESNF